MTDKPNYRHGFEGGFHVVRSKDHRAPKMNIADLLEYLSDEITDEEDREEFLHMTHEYFENCCLEIVMHNEPVNVSTIDKGGSRRAGGIVTYAMNIHHIDKTGRLG